jgi:dATP pyrophosphohydrolase
MTKVKVRCIDCHIAFINDGNPKYLILQRSEHKRYPLIWQPVTGKIDSNEKPIDAALRETKEETGLYPQKLWSIDTVNYYYDPKENIMNLIPVFGMLVNTTNIRLSNEHQAFEWLDIKEAEKRLLWSQQKRGIKQFNEILKNPNSPKSQILKLN